MARSLLGTLADKLQAAASLASQGNESALEYLRARCLSRKPLERCSALELLGESRHPQAVESIQEYLSDPARPEWLSAARGLAMHRSPEAKIRLKSALGSVDAELRGSVMDWLNERHLSLEVEAQSKRLVEMKRLFGRSFVPDAPQCLGSGRRRRRKDAR